MTLHEWLKAHNITEKRFADLTGMSHGAVRKWRQGERFPRPEALARIAEATNGAVTANDFFAQETVE